MSSYVSGTSDQPLLYQTVGATLERAAERWPLRDALIIPQQNIRWSWLQLNDAANRLAQGFLSLGLKPGDRIGIWSPNRVEWVVTQFASAKAGLILVTINPAYRISELESALNKVGANSLVLAPSFKKSNYVAMIRELAPEIETGVPGDLKLARLPHLRSLVLMGEEVVPGFIPYDSLSRDADASDDLQQLATQLQPEDPINIQFTSGTTGLPKGATLKGVAHQELVGQLLDLGTGSGVLALLLRSMGAHDITASDVSASAVGLACENEILNFRGNRISFFSGDLFAGLPEGARYDTVIFNPPGWRTPSKKFLDRLRGNEEMTPETMFYGDELLLRFLKDLPDRMNRTGRAIVGLNSLVGISDVLARYKASYPKGAPLQFQLLERHSLPLLFYSPGWKRAEPFLLQEFETWRDSYGAAYTIDGQGRLYWSYEVVECKSAPTALL